MYINIKTASKIHPSNSILKCAIIPIIDTEVSFGISFGALSLTTTYSVLNLFINRCVTVLVDTEKKKRSFFFCSSSQQHIGLTTTEE